MSLTTSVNISSWVGPEQVVAALAILEPEDAVAVVVHRLLAS